MNASAPSGLEAAGGGYEPDSTQSRLPQFGSIKSVVARRVFTPTIFNLWRVLARTWRIEQPDADVMRRAMEQPRLVIAYFHGMIVPCFGVIDKERRRYSRRMVAAMGPGSWARLLARVLERFEWSAVPITTVKGMIEFVHRVEAGYIGTIAVDGPLGPRCVAKPGVVKIAAMARAHMLLGVASADHSLPLGLWDGTRVPPPFARVRTAVELLPPPGRADASTSLAAIERKLLAAACAINSPVVPAALRIRVGRGR